MAEGLEDVLRKLHIVLTQLNTVLENQDRLRNNAENDVENDVRSDASISSQTLDQWLQDRTPTKDRLSKIRNDFIHGITMIYIPGAPHDGPAYAINLFRETHSQDFTLHLRNRDYRIHANILTNLSWNWSQLRELWLEDMDKSWPEAFADPEPAVEIRTLERPSGTSRNGTLYLSDSSGYPLLYEQSSSNQDELAPGRIIIKCIDKGVIDFETLAVLSSWLQGPEGYIESQFILNFAERWGFRYKLQRVNFCQYQFRMEYHLRHCHKSTHKLIPKNSYWVHPGRPLGILLHRQNAVIGLGGYMWEVWGPGARGRTNFSECRSSLSLTVAQLSDTLAYTLLAVVDTDDGFIRIPLPDKKLWKEHGIIPCGKAIGIAQFQVMICVIANQWGKDWVSTLDAIDGKIRIELDVIANEEWLNRLMFDSSFKLSRLYFTVLQLLRIMDEWVEQSVTDLKNLRDEWLQKKHNHTSHLSADELRSIEKNWDTAVSSMELRAKKLLYRINRKTEEVKSLRDGLFNATSLREASKGMVLSRAIYVFTAVTVIYTPLGFMATFWALPIFSSSLSNGGGTSLTAFISTFVLVPLLTYLVSLFAVGYFSLESSRRSVNSERALKTIDAVIEAIRATGEWTAARLVSILLTSRWIVIQGLIVYKRAASRLAAYSSAGFNS
ncbi:hypothetical protein F4677DRAFT_88922 [Hypoxylon crocopeplum]|nr:hypothetical protein F4677DRAFT_88922 [Hypoxylon crocopeplum]